MCVCTRGFTGKLCDKNQNSCLSSPCKNSNDSRCVPTSTGSFQCVCGEYLDGEFCERITYLKAPYVANLNGKSYIEKPSVQNGFNLIDIVFYSKRTDGERNSVKII